MRGRFQPRKKESLKKIEKPDRTSLIRTKSVRKNKMKASMSINGSNHKVTEQMADGSNHKIAEMMNDFEEQLIKRESTILDSSIIDNASSSISKPGSGIALDFSKNLSSSYLRDK